MYKQRTALVHIGRTTGSYVDRFEHYLQIERKTLIKNRQTDVHTIRKEGLQTKYTDIMMHQVYRDRDIHVDIDIDIQTNMYISVYIQMDR